MQPPTPPPPPRPCSLALLENIERLFTLRAGGCLWCGPAQWLSPPQQHITQRPHTHSFHPPKRSVTRVKKIVIHNHFDKNNFESNIRHDRGWVNVSRVLFFYIIFRLVWISWRLVLRLGCEWPDMFIPSVKDYEQHHLAFRYKIHSHFHVSSQSF